jgi:hypothetical protein
MSVCDGGFESAPMASDSFLGAHGRFEYREVNVSHNHHLGGASAGFAVFSSAGCSLSQIRVVNNSCELGRTVFVQTSAYRVRVTQLIVANTGGGPLGVVTLGGANWTFEEVWLIDNDQDSDWMVGFVKENKVTMIGCVISLSASDFDLRTERVVVIHDGTKFGGSHFVAPILGGVLNDTNFAGLARFNETHPLHGKVDKFIQMRSDDIYREPDVALLNESVICLFFPVFIMVAFVWMRAIYAPKPELGTFLN